MATIMMVRYGKVRNQSVDRENKKFYAERGCEKNRLSGSYYKKIKTIKKKQRLHTCCGIFENNGP